MMVILLKVFIVYLITIVFAMIPYDILINSINKHEQDYFLFLMFLYDGDMKKVNFMFENRPMRLLCFIPLFNVLVAFMLLIMYFAFKHIRNNIKDLM